MMSRRRAVVPIGRVRGRQVLTTWHPDPREGSANPHMLVCGASGFGKTYFLVGVQAELSRLGFPTLIFDLGQGFSPRELPSGFAEVADPGYVTVNRDGVAVNPLTVFSSDVRGPVNVAQRVADTFRRVYPRLGIQQHAAIRDATLEALRRNGITVEDPGSWIRRPPPFRAVQESLAAQAEDRENLHRRVAATALSHISAFFIFDVFRSQGRKVDWDHLLERGRPTIFELDGLETSVATAATEFLLWNLVAHVEALGPGPLRGLVVIDEAHRIPLSDESPLERVLREGRKFGLGIILASQQPYDFGDLAFANTATQIVFQIDDPRGKVSRRLAEKTRSWDSEDVRSVVTRLPRGTAFVVNRNSGKVVDVDSFAARAERWDLSTAAARPEEPGDTGPLAIGDVNLFDDLF